MACTRLELQAIEENPQIFRIYEPVTMGDGKRGIDSIFYNEIGHISWYSLDNTKVRGQSSPGENPDKCVVTYKINSKYHYLIYSYLDGLLPAISVKPEFVDTCRIRHCKNIPSRIVEKAVCRIDNSFIIQEMSSEWLLFNPEFFRKVGHDKSVYRGLGHTDELQKYSNILPQFKINQMQPWSYSMKTYNSFPLYRLNSQTELIHEYTYNLAPNRVLQMQVLEDDKWVNIVPDLTKLDGLTSETKFINPSLHACTGMIRDIEMKKRDGPYRMFTESVLTYYSESQPCGSKNNVKIKLEDKGSYKALFWGAKNMTSCDLNIHGNFTTSLDDIDNGLSPIKDTTLLCKDKKFKELGGNHTSGPTLYHHFPSCPTINGLHGYSFCMDPTDVNANVGILLGDMNSELQINLQDPDCERWKSGNVDLRGRNCPPKCNFPFVVVVCALLQKEYTIENGVITDVFDNIDTESFNTF